MRRKKNIPVIEGDQIAGLELSEDERPKVL
jgi:hypothetical protein